MLCSHVRIVLFPCCIKKLVFGLFILICSSTRAQDSVADALCNVGNALYKEGNIAQAHEEYSRALTRCPDHEDSIMQLGIMYFQEKQYNKAQQYLEKRVEQYPKDEEAAIRLAHCALWQKRYPIAIELYSRILKINPQRVDLYLYRAQCYKRQQLFSQALADIERFLAAFPNDHQAQLIKAYIFEQMGAYDQAIIILNDLPQSHKVLAAQAHLYKTIGKTDQAIDLYERAYALAPEQRSYLLGISYSYLLAGDMARGYSIMKKYLLNQKNHPRFLDNRDKIPGKRIFIGAEILLDNMIQHVRFAQCIQELGGTTIVQAPEPLLALLQNCPMIDELVSTTQPTPAYDYHIPAILLPWLFESTAPETVPYLAAHHTLVEQWQKALPNQRKKKIGICWHLTETLHSPAEQRTIPIQVLNPLFALTEYQFIALYHKKQTPDLTHLESSDQLITMCGSGFSEDPQEMARLAALIESVETVITIDTTIAHLAGALGKKTYLLLPYHTNWRWGLTGTNSAWYPTITIIRQRAPGDWHAPIQELISMLKSPI